MAFYLKYKVGDILSKKGEHKIDGLHEDVGIIKILKAEGSYYEVEFIRSVDDNDNIFSFYHYTDIENLYKLDIKAMRKEKIKEIEKNKN